MKMNRVGNFANINNELFITVVAGPSSSLKKKKQNSYNIDIISTTSTFKIMLKNKIKQKQNHYRIGQIKDHDIKRLAVVTFKPRFGVVVH